MTDESIEERATKVHDLVHLIIKELNEIKDDYPSLMTVLTLVNSDVLYHMLRGKNPTIQLERLQENIEKAYSDICANERLKK